MKRRLLIFNSALAALLVALAGASWWLGWIDFYQPLWLMALLGLPLLLWVAYRGIAGLPPATSSLATAVRTVVLLLVIFALADLQLVLRNDGLCVFFLIDRSASIPEHIVEQELAYARQVSEEKGPDDQVGVTVFGRQASIEALPSPEFQVSTLRSAVDPNHTNLEQAVRLTMAAFPANMRRKLVLITDGNQNNGEVLEAVRDVAAEGVAVDVLPVSYDYPQEVLVEKIFLPDRIRENETFDLKVHIRSLAQNGGELTIYRDGVPVAREEVELQAGANTFVVPQKLVDPGFFTYTARITPRSDQIAQNNQATNYVYIQGESRVLIVSPTLEEAKYLAAACRSENLEVDIVGPEELPLTLGGLQNHDCVVLCNIPAELIPQGLEQMDMLRAAVRDLGIGLVMVGGINSFGAGDYDNTPIEEALPVTMDIKQKRIIPKGSLALILHTCEFPDGNYWAKEISKEAIRTINAQDEVGVVYYDWNRGEQWLFDLQAAQNKQKLYNLIDGVEPGDMPAFGPPFQLAYNGLINSDAMVKHMIVISDGDPTSPAPQMIKNMAAAGITCSTVGINPHTPRDVDVLKYIARNTGGRYYFARDPAELPRIFVKEAKVVKRSLIFNEPFQPLLVMSGELTKGLTADELPPLNAYVATTAKPRAMVPIVSDNENHDPVLAYWRYGLGKSVAFTSDASSNWAADWVMWEKYNKFWGQAIRWASRKRDTSNLEISTRLEGTSGKMIVDAIDEDGNFVNLLKMNARLVDPENEGQELTIRQTAPGRYEADFDASEVGINLLSVSYLNPDTGQQGFMASGVSVPYSAEYRELQTNTPLLEEVAETAGGRLLAGDPATDPVFVSTLPPVEAFQPVWYWLAAVALCLFLLDVVLRRVLLTRHDLVTGWHRVLAVFGRERERQSDDTMDALLRRKRAVFQQQGEQTGSFQEELARRSRQPRDDIETVVAAGETPDKPAAAAPPPATGDAAKPPPEQEESSYTGRLLAAKRRAREKKDNQQDED